MPKFTDLNSLAITDKPFEAPSTDKKFVPLDSLSRITPSTEDILNNPYNVTKMNKIEGIGRYLSSSAFPTLGYSMNDPDIEQKYYKATPIGEQLGNAAIQLFGQAGAALESQFSKLEQVKETIGRPSSEYLESEFNASEALREKYPVFKSSDEVSGILGYIPFNGSSFSKWTNFAPNLGFTLGTAGGVFIENLVATALIEGTTGGLGTPLAGANIIKSFYQAGRDIVKFRNFATLGKTLSNTTKLYGSAGNILRAAESLKAGKSLNGMLHGLYGSYALYSNTAAEALVENANSVGELVRDLKNDFIDKNGREPNGDELAKMQNAAEGLVLPSSLGNISVLMASNFLQQTNAFKAGKSLSSLAISGSKVLGKQLEKRMVLDQATGLMREATSKEIRNQMVKSGLSSALSIISEGLEESAQGIVSKATQDFQKAKYYDKTLSWTESLGAGFTYAMSDEGLEEFAAGIVTGTLFTTGGYSFNKYQGKVDRAKLKQQTGKTFDETVKDEITNFNESVIPLLKYTMASSKSMDNLKYQSVLAERIRQAGEDGDGYAVENYKNAGLVSAMFTAKHYGKDKVLLDYYKELTDLERSDLAKYFDSTEEELDTKENFDKNIQKLERISELVDIVAERYKNKYPKTTLADSKYSELNLSEQEEQFIRDNTAFESWQAAQELLVQQLFASEQIKQRISKATADLAGTNVSLDLLAALQTQTAADQKNNEKFEKANPEYIKKREKYEALVSRQQEIDLELENIKESLNTLAGESKILNSQEEDGVIIGANPKSSFSEREIKSLLERKNQLEIEGEDIKKGFEDLGLYVGSGKRISKLRNGKEVLELERKEAENQKVMTPEVEREEELADAALNYILDLKNKIFRAEQSLSQMDEKDRLQKKSIKKKEEELDQLNTELDILLNPKLTVEQKLKQINESRPEANKLVFNTNILTTTDGIASIQDILDTFTTLGYMKQDINYSQNVIELLNGVDKMDTYSAVMFQDLYEARKRLLKNIKDDVTDEGNLIPGLRNLEAYTGTTPVTTTTVTQTPVQAPVQTPAPAVVTPTPAPVAATPQPAPKPSKLAGFEKGKEVYYNGELYTIIDMPITSEGRIEFTLQNDSETVYNVKVDELSLTKKEEVQPVAVEAPVETPKEVKSPETIETDIKAKKADIEKQKQEGENKDGSIYKSTTKEKDGRIITNYESYRKEDGKKYTLGGRTLTKEEFLNEYTLDEDGLDLLEGVEKIIIREVRDNKGNLAITVRLKFLEGWMDAEIKATYNTKSTSLDSKKETSASDIEAKKSDIEKRRKEELSKFGTSTKQTEKNSIKVHGVNEYVTRDLMELAYSNDSGNNPKLGGAGQTLDRIIERGGYSKDELLNLLNPEIDKINAKYDAELAALEGKTETITEEQPITEETPIDQEQKQKEEPIVNEFYNTPETYEGTENENINKLQEEEEKEVKELEDYKQQLVDLYNSLVEGTETEEGQTPTLEALPEDSLDPEVVVAQVVDQVTTPQELEKAAAEEGITPEEAKQKVVAAVIEDFNNDGVNQKSRKGKGLLNKIINKVKKALLLFVLSISVYSSIFAVNINAINKPDENLISIENLVNNTTDNIETIVSFLPDYQQQYIFRGLDKLGLIKTEEASVPVIKVSHTSDATSAILSEASKYLGQREKGDSTISDYGSKNLGFNDKTFETLMISNGFKKGYAWCSIFVKTVLNQRLSAEGRQFVNTLITPSVNQTFSNIQNADNPNFKIVSDSELKPGSIVFYTNEDNTEGHIVLVNKVNANGTFETIEGNSNDEGAREGYEVVKRTRTLRAEKLQLRGIVNIDFNKLTKDNLNFYVEHGRVKDKTRATSDQDSLLIFERQSTNEDGLSYIPGKTKQHSNSDEAYSGVTGVAHFLITHKGVDLTNATSATSKEAAKKDILSQYKKENPNGWIPVFQKNSRGNITLRFKKLNEVNDTDMVVTRLYQRKFGDLDFNRYKKSRLGSNSVIYDTVRNQGVDQLQFSDKNAFSRKSGGSAVFIFEVNGKVIIREAAGSINFLKAVGDNIVKQYKINAKDLTIGFFDAGSYAAKPAANRGKITIDQYEGYNSSDDTGASLMIPMGNNGTAQASIGILALLSLLKRKKKNKEKITPEDLEDLRQAIVSLDSKIEEIKNAYKDRRESVRKYFAKNKKEPLGAGDDSTEDTVIDTELKESFEDQANRIADTIIKANDEGTMLLLSDEDTKFYADYKSTVDDIVDKKLGKKKIETQTKVKIDPQVGFIEAFNKFFSFGSKLDPQDANSLYKALDKIKYSIVPSWFKFKTKEASIELKKAFTDLSKSKDSDNKLAFPNVEYTNIVSSKTGKHSHRLLNAEEAETYKSFGLFRHQHSMHININEKNAKEIGKILFEFINKYPAYALVESSYSLAKPDNVRIYTRNGALTQGQLDELESKLKLLENVDSEPIMFGDVSYEMLPTPSALRDTINLMESEIKDVVLNYLDVNPEFMTNLKLTYNNGLSLNSLEAAKLFAKAYAEFKRTGEIKDKSIIEPIINSQLKKTKLYGEAKEIKDSLEGPDFTDLMEETFFKQLIKKVELRMRDLSVFDFGAHTLTINQTVYNATTGAEATVVNHTLLDKGNKLTVSVTIKEGTKELEFTPYEFKNKYSINPVILQQSFEEQKQNEEEEAEKNDFNRYPSTILTTISNDDDILYGNAEVDPNLAVGRLVLQNIEKEESDYFVKVETPGFDDETSPFFISSKGAYNKNVPTAIQDLYREGKLKNFETLSKEEQDELISQGVQPFNKIVTLTDKNGVYTKFGKDGAPSIEGIIPMFFLPKGTLSISEDQIMYGTKSDATFTGRILQPTSRIAEKRNTTVQNIEEEKRKEAKTIEDIRASKESVFLKMLGVSGGVTDGKDIINYTDLEKLTKTRFLLEYPKVGSKVKKGTLHLNINDNLIPLKKKGMGKEVALAVLAYLGMDPLYISSVHNYTVGPEILKAVSKLREELNKTKNKEKRNEIYFTHLEQLKKTLYLGENGMFVLYNRIIKKSTQTLGDQDLFEALVFPEFIKDEDGNVRKVEKKTFYINNAYKFLYKKSTNRDYYEHLNEVVDFLSKVSFDASPDFVNTNKDINFVTEDDVITMKEVKTLPYLLGTRDKEGNTVIPAKYETRGIIVNNSVLTGKNRYIILGDSVKGPTTSKPAKETKKVTKKRRVISEDDFADLDYIDVRNNFKPEGEDLEVLKAEAIEQVIGLKLPDDEHNKAMNDISEATSVKELNTIIEKLC